MKVTAMPSSGTAAAVRVRSLSRDRLCGAMRLTIQPSRSRTSRSTVKTNSDENKPRNSRPIQASVSDTGGLAMRRENMPTGTNTAEAISSRANRAPIHAPGNGGMMRAPMYKCRAAERPSR